MRKPKSPILLTMKAFFACVGCGGFLEPEADQQIGSQAHAFPANKQQEGISSEHKNCHEKHEQVHVREISPVSLVIVHVADGINVDQETNARDDEQHNQRKLVENKAEIDCAMCLR